MSHIHKIKHKAHHHKEKIKHHAAHHKEKVKYHAHRHKERIRHHVRRRKESLPQIIFNKNLVIIFLITLAIPLTVFLASQQQDLEKKASENDKPIVKGYIIEFNEKSLSQEIGIASSGVDNKEERRKNVENRNKELKEEVLNIIGESTASGEMREKARGKVKGEYTNVISGVALDITAEQAAKIKKDVPGVKAVHPNFEVKEAIMDSVPLIAADKVWNLRDSSGSNITGRNVIIAIIDTGIDYRHPDLGGSSAGQIFNSKVIGGYDFINSDADPMDDKGHGTHVAGIAAGNGVLKGVAPEAKLIAYKVLDSAGSGSFASVLSGIDAAVGTRLDASTTNDVAVINLSVGAYCGTTYSDSCGPNDVLSRAIDNASSNGIAAVVAAGNTGGYGPGSINTPGTARSAITVGSISKTKIVSTFSSRGPVTLSTGEIINKPDVVAPGEGILDLETNDPLGGICSAKASVSGAVNCLDQNHVTLKGTSMAAPHVAGMAALVKQQSPLYNGSEIKYMLVQNATSLGYDFNTQGKGMVDANKIFILNPTPSLTLAPTNTPTPTFTPIPSKTPTPTPTPVNSPTPISLRLTLNPAGDAFVRSSAAGKNFGTSTSLQVDSTPNEITYMKFNLGALNGKTIISAKLRIKVSDATSKSLNLRRGVAGNWNESTINYNNRPGFEATIGGFNANTRDQVIELDVKNAVTLRLGGTLTLGVTSSGDGAGAFYSRESSTSNRPQLIIEYR